MFIQDINNLSGGFMPSLGAFLWSDKLFRAHGENARALTTKRKCVLLQTQVRSDQNARAFLEVL